MILHSPETVVFTILGVLIAFIFIRWFFECGKKKKDYYRCHIRHYLDLIEGETGDVQARKHGEEILRISRRHSIPLDEFNCGDSDYSMPGVLMRAVDDSLKRYQRTLDVLLAEKCVFERRLELHSQHLLASEEIELLRIAAQKLSF